MKNNRIAEGHYQTPEFRVHLLSLTPNSGVVQLFPETVSSQDKKVQCDPWWGIQCEEDTRPSERRALRHFQERG